MSVIQIILSIIYVILGVAISVVILMQEGKSNGLGSAPSKMFVADVRTAYGRCPGAFYQVRSHCIYGNYHYPEYPVKDSGIIREQKRT